MRYIHIVLILVWSSFVFGQDFQGLTATKYALFDLGIESDQDPVTIRVGSPSKVSKQNDVLIIRAIEKARQIHAKTPKRLVIIEFDKGKYILSKPIVLNYSNGDSYTKLRGVTSDDQTKRTELILSSGTYRYLLELNGSNTYAVSNSARYDANDNSISLASEEYAKLKNKSTVELIVTNGKWATGQLKLKSNYMGQINVISRRSGKKIYLDRSFNIGARFLDGTNKLIVATFNPITNIGLENLFFTHSKKLSSNASLVKINGGYNIFLTHLIFRKPSSSHLSIERSYNVKVENSYFYDAFMHGGGGQGYGIALGGKSTGCIIQNNYFSKLRHSIVLSTAANSNIIAYNTSEDQYSTDNNGRRISGLGDISLHGFLPYANLIEGNSCELIRADGYWGKNGPLNIFNNNRVKNKMQFDDIMLPVISSNVVSGSKDKDQNLGRLNSFKGGGSLYLNSAQISKGKLSINKSMINSIKNF